MTEITLETAQAKVAELTDIIAKLMKPLPTTMTLAIAAATIELRPGEHYAGPVLDETGLIKHHLVLMAEKPAGALNWSDAMAWASGVGGALPTRQEAALIFANCKPHVEAAWHWTSETYEPNASYAWFCYFYGGNQSSYYKDYEGSCRAVRRVIS